jgi:hypothetical protein
MEPVRIIVFENECEGKCKGKVEKYFKTDVFILLEKYKSSIIERALIDRYYEINTYFKKNVDNKKCDMYSTVITNRNAHLIC